MSAREHESGHYWSASKQRLMPIAEMHGGHVANAIKVIERKLETAAYGAAPTSDDEIKAAQSDAEEFIALAQELDDLKARAAEIAANEPPPAEGA